MINSYDRCVANAMIESHQMTMTWHVDDIKASHKDPYQITKFASYLSIIYGEKLKVKRGNVHDYLGMDLYCSDEISVKVSMINHTGKILRALHENIAGRAASPSVEHSFKVGDEKEA